MYQPDYVSHHQHDIILRCRQPECFWQISGADVEGAGVFAAYILHTLHHRIATTKDGAHETTGHDESSAGRV